MSCSAPSVSGRRSEDRYGKQDSSVADGPFSPAGLKVLVVDDDPMCLKVVSAMLKRCHYEVETKQNGQEALALLRERQDEDQQFDLVLSDVYMPDIDGFKLLEHIGLELDIPVIMMSSNGDTSVVLRGVTHGAVDFLIKPVRVEELRNVWQHVVRRKSLAHSRTGDDGSVDCDGDGSRHGTKRKEADVLRAEHETGSNNKKQRVIWTQEMHQQFVGAVNQLGIDKAFPKRILDLMRVEGLTRENVASHLQKYRLYLKRVEGHANGHASNMTGGKGGFGGDGAGGAGDGEDAMMHTYHTQQQQRQSAAGRSGRTAASSQGQGGRNGGQVEGMQTDPPQHQQHSQQQQASPPAAPSAAGTTALAQAQQQVAAQQHAMMGMASLAAWQQQAMAMQAAAAQAAAAASGVNPAGMPNPFMPPGMGGNPMMPPPNFAAMAAAGMPPFPGQTSNPPPRSPMDMNAMMMANYQQAAATQAQAQALAVMRYPSAPSPGTYSAPQVGISTQTRLPNSHSMPSFASHGTLLPGVGGGSQQREAGGNGSGGTNHGSASTTASKPNGGMFGGEANAFQPSTHDDGPGLLSGTDHHHQPYQQQFGNNEDPLLHGLDPLSHSHALDDPLGLSGPPAVKVEQGVDDFLDMFLDNAHGNNGHQ